MNILKITLAIIAILVSVFFGYHQYKNFKSVKSQIIGYVTDNKNNPIVGVEVVVNGHCIEGSPKLIKSGIDGSFNLNIRYVDDCQFDLVLSHSDYITIRRIPDLKEYIINNPHIFTMKAK